LRCARWSKVVDGQRAAVGELSFEVIPDLFVGIEFRRVGREAFDTRDRWFYRRGFAGLKVLDPAA